ncbi:hypothetical protein [Flagellimonas sp. CMM7]|uniref:hypothetical protein n=1 Tax=Flagellimonas sp. CMM7 TaxID=2654676 RepID=UPI0013D19E56|nr:hypothetical protein [Flagellimonas sp. CMM7]UII80082.1 hypothetical protein LV704_00840 [Flagellimonas sp. CMM7]
MKKISCIKLPFLLVVILLHNITEAQKFEETIFKELTIENKSKVNFFVLQNVKGQVHIEGYDGGNIKMEIKKIITAKNQDALELGIDEINLGIEEKGKYIYVYLDSPWTDFKLSSGRINYNENGNSGLNRYDYMLNFKVKVPHNINLKATTITNGDIIVKDIFGDEIIANNIKGAITLDNVSGKTKVNAHNEDITINYYTNPDGRSSYHTLNGNIDITFKENLNADVLFKGLKGTIYTNFKTSKSDYTKRKNIKKRGRKHHNESFKIGKGGVKLDFHVLNGDVLLRD